MTTPIDRVPHVDNIVFNPPITLDELALRLHRKGNSDARVRYALNVALSVTSDADPERVSSLPENLRRSARLSIRELKRDGETAPALNQDVAIGDISEDLRVASLRVSHSVPYYNGVRFRLLATTPLEAPDEPTR